MKITTQRQILWIVNFLLVLGLLGFVFLMQKNGGRARNRALKTYVRSVEGALRGVKLPRVSDEGTAATSAKLRTFLDKKFSFEGYIPPKVEKKPDTGPRKAIAPKLESLIEVDMVLAPSAAVPAAGGGGDVVNAGAFIKIRSLGQKASQFSTYWYRIGETIGAGHDYRADEDPVLKKWGPCVLLEVHGDGIVCAWNKEADKAKVEIQLHPDPDKVWIEGQVNGRSVKYGGPGAINNKKVGVGVVTPAGIGLSLFKPGKDSRGDQLIEFTKEGIDLFERGEGEKLLEQIGTKQEKSGLRVTTIPRQLREFGLREGDVVIKVDNTPVKNKSTVTNYVRKNYRKKKQFQVTVLRDGRTRSFGVRVPKNTRNINTSGQGVRFGQ